ncbi:MAG: chromosomal replication initiator protein DnaA [Muribaculaceae bacterium]|nr:chromosomal replication initiator protein DnaA [Muribaculaceae bacterium]
MEKNHQQLWEEYRLFIKDNIPPAQFDAWFRDVDSLGFDGKNLTLMVPSQYIVEQLESRFFSVLAAAIRKTYGQGVNLYYHFNQVKDEPDTSVKMLSADQSPEILRRKESNPFAESPVDDIDPQLNPRYNFENYCRSVCNKVACGIGESIADDPSIKTFNPLFIFGESGVGKTHLIQAIGIRIKERNPRAKVLYVTARLFQSQYTTAEAKGTTNSFFHFYQSIDTLIIDDVQDLRDKPKTQNTFFHIFNHLHQNGKQIIMSSDCSPADMEGFPERLLTRFRWGMNVRLEAPDIELRRSVLVHKAEQDGLSLPPEVIDYIASNVTDSIRELEGVVISLIGRAAVLNIDIDVALAKSVVANAVRINRRQINFELVTSAVCTHFNIDPDLIFTKSRKREISDARQVVMFLAKKLIKMPLTAIGARLGRTHATVLYACKNLEERIPLDKQLADDLLAIEADINS